jgi:two-component system, NarL family, sensor kinase
MDTTEEVGYRLLIITTIILGVILLYFIISLIRHQRRNLKLYQEKVAAEVTTLENERRRMAADLHDEIGPTLSGIKLLISGIEPRNESEAALLQKINGYINNTIQRMRDISNNLMPRVLEKRGIEEALDQLFDETMKVHPIKISFEHSLAKEPDDNQKLHLYRVVQEILHNTIKHAKANLLEISLTGEENSISFTSQDDGVGFAYKGEVRKASGLGLRNLMSRTEILNGQISIESVPSKGTKINLNFPL